MALLCVWTVQVLPVTPGDRRNECRVLVYAGVGCAAVVGVIARTGPIESGEATLRRLKARV
jgi:hypothetical protein